MLYLRCAHKKLKLYYGYRYYADDIYMSCHIRRLKNKHRFSTPYIQRYPFRYIKFTPHGVTMYVCLYYIRTALN